MQIKVVRETFTQKSTIGTVYVDDVKFGYCLEDPVRKDGVKVYGETAIPAGTYRVIWNKSKRFSREKGKDVFMPLLLDVPGFAGIRIHVGNYPKDTLGCLLIGYDKGKDFIGRSRLATNALYKMIQSAKHGVTVQVC